MSFFSIFYPLQKLTPPRKKLKTDDSSTNCDQEMSTTSDDSSTSNSDQSNQSIADDDRSTKIDNDPPIFSDVDCLIRIFSYLSLRDRRSVELTCNCWRNISLNETPLNKSILSVKIYEQKKTDSSRQFRVTFDDVFWQVPFVRNGPRGRLETDLDLKTRLFFQRFLSNYGRAVRRLDFGGDYLPIFDQSIPKFTPRLRRRFLQQIGESCWKNLKSITFRQVVLMDNEWQRLAETIDILTRRGCLEILRFNSIVGQIASPAISLSLARSLNRLKRLELIDIPTTIVVSISEAMSNLEREENGDGRERPKLKELLISMNHHGCINSGTPNLKIDYLSILKIASTIDLVLCLHVSPPQDANVVMSEILRLTAGRLRRFHLCIFHGGHPDSIWNVGNLLTKLYSNSIVDTLREFHFSLSNAAINGDNVFSHLIDRLASIPSLRGLTLDKLHLSSHTFPPQLLPLLLFPINARPNFCRLANLDRLETLDLNGDNNLKESDLIDTINRLSNLKRLRLEAISCFTLKTLFSLTSKLESLEIEKCKNFKPQSLFERILEYRLNRPGEKSISILTNLEHLKIRDCRHYGFLYLQNNETRFDACQVRVRMNMPRREVVLFIANHEKWLFEFESILPAFSNKVINWMSY